MRFSPDMNLMYLCCSVPEAIIAFLEADSYEDAIRNAVSLGGDADTQGAKAGAYSGQFIQFLNTLLKSARNVYPMIC